MRTKHLILNHFSIFEFQTLIRVGQIDISEKKLELVRPIGLKGVDFGDWFGELDTDISLVIYRPKLDLFYEVFVSVTDYHKFHNGEWWLTLKKCGDVRVA